jgi:anti-sigma factor (TIGR02949 family)
MANDVRDIDCHSALKQIWDFLDLELTQERMAEVRKHLTTCQHCLPHHDFARRFLDALQATREGKVTPVELRASVMRQLADSGYSPS